MVSWLLLSLLGCSLPSGGPRWTPVDTEALEADLEEPTASLDSTLSWLEDHAGRLTLLVATGGTVDQVVRRIAAPSESPEVEHATGELQGTEVYVRVDCPGLDPDTQALLTEEASADTGAELPGPGSIQVDSPLLGFDDIDDLGVRGDILLVAEACGHEDRLTHGTLPAWYDAPSQWLALDGSAAVRALPAPALDLGLRAILSSEWRFSVPVLDGGTITLTVPAASTDAGTLSYDGGQLACELAPEVRCQAD